MRKVFVKFSGQRSKENATVTSILNDGENGFFVEKRAIYQEGYENLTRIYESREVLERTYPGCRVCKMELKPEEKIGAFEFLAGDAIGDRYVAAVEKGDYQAFFDTMEIHKQIFLRNESNLVDFEPCQEYIDLFGDPTPYLGKKAFRATNFEATAFNIILDAETEQPVLFDYECVYEFPIPVDVVLYHCVFRTLYLCMPQLSGFISREHFLRRLALGTDKHTLEETWKEWRNNFSFGSKKTEAEEDAETENTPEDEYISEDYASRYRKHAFALEKVMTNGLKKQEKKVNGFVRFKTKVKKWMPKPIYAVLKKLFRPLFKGFLD